MHSRRDVEDKFQSLAQACPLRVEVGRQRTAGRPEKEIKSTSCGTSSTGIVWLTFGSPENAACPPPWLVRSRDTRHL